MPAAIGPIDGVAVLGGGAAFPERRPDNEAVLASLPGGARRSAEQRAFTAEGVRRTLGLWRRAWAHPVGTPLDPEREPTSLDLATDAARAALADAGVAATDLALVLCATSTPHRMTGTVSAALGAALGAEAACMDTRAGCAAGLFGLATAALYLAAGAGPVLLVGTETFSKVVPPGNELAALSLGDGAGALVLGARPGASLRAAWMRTDGTLGHLVSTPGPMPPTLAAIEAGGYLLDGSPEALAAALPARYAEALDGALARAGIAAAEVDLFVPHQTSLPLIDVVAGQAGIPLERTWREGVARHGNVGAAGWVVALVEARAAGRCPPGTTVALAAVGGGMSWAAAVLRM